MRHDYEKHIYLCLIYLRNVSYV